MKTADVGQQMEPIEPGAWAERMAVKLDEKMRRAVRAAREIEGIPYSTGNGRFTAVNLNWWTNGFWPAAMWQMFLMTRDGLYREEAIRCETLLDGALRDFKKLDHDVGFMWLIHSGVRCRLEGNMESLNRTLFAADMLAGRFNPNGFIRAWNGEGREGWAIIDCMMNLPLLYWASRQTGDPRYRLIAMAHADTAMRMFVRGDGSCNHIVIFDPENGAFIDNPAGQGYAAGSSWSRGQSWGLYGFTLSYLYTGKQEYLDTARRISDYFIGQVKGDYLPRCDFRQPEEPRIYDNAAGNIAACGLLELAKLVTGQAAMVYRDAACRILFAQEQDAADWSETTPAVFTKCTSAYHNLSGRHITMNYADYFFIEAVNKLRGEELLFWVPFPAD